MVGVLRYWRAVELFSPPTIPNPPKQPPRTAGDKWVLRVEPKPGGRWPLLAWEGGHPLQRISIDQKNFAWRHTVYGGVFSLETIRQTLAEAFGEDDEDYGGARRRGDSAVFAFTVDEDGVLLEDTVVFSACAWATGRIFDPGPSDPAWLGGFTDTALQCKQAINRLTHCEVPYRTLAEAVSKADPASGEEGSGGDGWRSVIGEVLGNAAETALTALIGGLGAKVVVNAAKPVVRKVSNLLLGTQKTSPGHCAENTDNDGDQTESETPPEPSTEEPGRPVMLADLVAFAAHVSDLCGVLGVVSPTSLRVHSQLVRRKKNGTLPDPEPVFINSSLPDDLERVADAAQDGYGQALTAYLTAPAAVRKDLRVDVRHNPSRVLAGVMPGQFPLGRWPAKSEQPLALSQQFAVNRIFDELANTPGLFSVNGPPGTGKTTLLRDLIAAIVVQRAQVLADLSSPKAGFTGTRSWNDQDGRTRTVRTLKPDLAGFEIVVASSNNGAVENITTELPALGAIHKDWRGEASYFVDQAVSLLDGEPAWGAVAAPLGNSDKRREFRQRFWWGENGNVGMQRLLQDLERGEILNDPPAAVRFPETEQEPTPARITPVGWNNAVARFRAALKTEATLRQARQSIDQALRVQSDLTGKRIAVEQKAAAAKRVLADREHDHDQVTKRLQVAQLQVDAAQNALDTHRAGRRRGIRSLGGNITREWKIKDEALEGDLTRRIDGLVVAQRAEAIADAVLTAARQNGAAVFRQAADTAVGSDRSRTIIESARRTMGDRLPEGWCDRTDDERELAAPWSDEEWICARTRVFLAALDLHRAFVVAAARPMRTNLNVLADVLKGGADAPPDAVFTAWQTLFLLVPVISTTFASCGRLFAALGRESLGWLLVDEAGQAVPQAAAGALWRARRGVIVGDPLQLEPVIQLPESVQRLLLNPYQVDPEWLPAGSSAQRLADRVNRWGTTLDRRMPDGEVEKVWVGSPLRVHRRCERPMFDLSNAIAYEHLMVYGTHEEPFPGPDQDPYPASCWIDVAPDPETKGKWVPAEGAALARVLTKLHHETAVNLDRIRVLSPFRDVIEGCRDIVRALQSDNMLPVEDRDDKGPLTTFIETQIGTVHTMQGKEADVVILILGTHSRRDTKARGWAAESPNLLNVAVSRAKRRLFVIGNREEWSKEPYFSTMADELRHHLWTPASRQAHNQ